MKTELLKPLMQPGIVRMNSSHAFSTSDTIEEVAQKTLPLNAPQRLREIFFSGEPREDVLLSLFIPQEGGRISVLDPTGPYYPDSVIIIAATEDILQEKGQVVKTHPIFDLPPLTQEAYWDVAREILRANPGSRYVENASSVFSNAKYRTPRTIGLPHAQIGKFDSNLVEPFPSDVTLDTPEFEKELSVLESDPRGKEALRRIKKDLMQKVPKRGDYYSWSMFGRSDRNALPMGYSIFLKGAVSNSFFTSFLNSHYEVYKEVMRDLIFLPTAGRVGLLPQPSFRFYIEEVDTGEEAGYLFTLSPNLYSHAGVNEAAGVLLDRKPEYPVNISPDERKVFLSNLREKLTQAFS